MKNNHIDCRNFYLACKNINRYEAVVLSKNYLRLDMYIKDVKNNLKHLGLNGNIMFDLVMTNGVKNRFFEMFFNGESFDLESLKSIKDVSSDVLNISHNYYKKHIECLDKAAMTTNQKELFKLELFSH